MRSDDLRDLNAFVAVAREGSFTRAAARLGVSQSALSQTVRSLEERLGVRLLNRTTRNVSPTEAGERLLARAAPALEEIEEGFTQLTALRDRPAGTIRISADEYAIHSVLWPRLPAFLAAYPDVRVELTTDYGRGDIVRDRQDAGVRRGRLVSKGMVAVRIGPDVRMAVVGAPSYLAGRDRPRAPQDLADHPCINLRLPTHGELFGWTFSRQGPDLHVSPDGPLVVTSVRQMLDGALAGLGFTYLPYDYVRPHIESGDLDEVLSDWSKTFEGYHLYYPSRRQQPTALAALVAALRYRP